jgi:nucleoside phosphorylase
VVEQDMAEIDFLIVTALEEERDAVLGRLPGFQRLPPSDRDVRIYYVSDLLVTFPDGSSGVYLVVVMPLLAMGRVQATAAASDAIHRWHPRYVILVGIAGGVVNRDAQGRTKTGVKLGDVLVADQIVDYELQKLTSRGPEIRWEVHRADPRLVGAAQNLDVGHCQELMTVARPGRGMPSRHIGPIASGDKVVAFEEALTKYHDQWPALIGVEMEAAGVAAASFQAASHPGFFMVRGVSDLADSRKGSAGVRKWRQYACEIAAEYMIALLRRGPVTLTASGNDSIGEARPIRAMHTADEQQVPDFDVQVLETSSEACRIDQVHVELTFRMMRRNPWPGVLMEISLGESRLPTALGLGEISSKQYKPRDWHCYNTLKPGYAIPPAGCDFQLTLHYPVVEAPTAGTQEQWQQTRIRLQLLMQYDTPPEGYGRKCVYVDVPVSLSNAFGELLAFGSEGT